MNVTYHFGVLLRYGVSVFVIKAIFFLVHIVKPQKKIAAAKGGAGTILFLAWVIALSSWRYSDAGVCCSAESTKATSYLVYWQTTGRSIWRVLVALYATVALGFVCCITAFFHVRRRGGSLM